MPVGKCGRSRLGASLELLKGQSGLQCILGLHGGKQVRSKPEPVLHIVFECVPEPFRQPIRPATNQHAQSSQVSLRCQGLSAVHGSQAPVVCKVACTHEACTMTPALRDLQKSPQSMASNAGAVQVLLS